MDLHTQYAAWEGSPGEATQEVAAVLRLYRPGILPPTERLLRKWRQDDVLTRQGRRFTGRNVLEAAYVAWRRSEGANLPAIVQQLRELDLEELAATLTRKPVPQSAAVSAQRVEQVAILLAYGVLKQFQAVRAGRAVGVGLSHPDPLIAAAALPLELRQAQAHPPRTRPQGCFDLR